MTKQSDGKWITYQGRHILIKDGETLEQAFSRDSKEVADSESDRQEKEINDRKNEKQARFNNWKNKIKYSALEDLEDLIEEIANDDAITNDEYTELYDYALSRLRGD